MPTCLMPPVIALAHALAGAPGGRAAAAPPPDSPVRAAGVPTDRLRGQALATRIVVEASDGYPVVFSPAELSPSFDGRRVVPADRVDRALLSDAEGPRQLLAPGDGGEHARWVRRVATIRVRTE